MSINNFSNPEKNPEKNDSLHLSNKQQVEIKIIDLNHEGEGVGRMNGFVFFVPGALPGEEITAAVESVSKKFARASLLSINKSSPHRQLSPCPYFNRCGGCQLQHLTYTQQLNWKHHKVKNDLKKIGGIETRVHPAKGMEYPYYYRNKARAGIALDRNNNILCGFHEKNSNRLVNIEECLIQQPNNTEIINGVRQTLQEMITSGALPAFFPRFLTAVTCRVSFHSGEALLELESTSGKIKLSQWKKLARELFRRLDSINGVFLYQNKGRHRGYTLLCGDSYLFEKTSSFTFRLSPGAFFQVNTRQASYLYQVAVNFCGEPQTAFDLYCGTGTMSLYLERRAYRVVGIDVDPKAVNDAKYNAWLNEARRVEFYTGKAEESVELLKAGDPPKTVVVDPPRKGCGSRLLKAIVEESPDRVVYISCNPSTLARDLSFLHSHNYKTQEVQPVDMFPQTTHIESVASLKLIK